MSCRCLGHDISPFCCLAYLHMRCILNCTKSKSKLYLIYKLGAHTRFLPVVCDIFCPNYVVCIVAHILQIFHTNLCNLRRKSQFAINRLVVSRRNGAAVVRFNGSLDGPHLVFSNHCRWYDNNIIIYNMRNNGPRIDPCGTPNAMFLYSDMSRSITTCEGSIAWVLRRAHVNTFGIFFWVWLETWNLSLYS